MFEYVAAGQTVHTVEAFAPTVLEYVPAGQPVQDELPLTSLNVPATHAVHAPPFGPVYPTLHWQSEIYFVVFVDCRLDCTGHEEH